MTRWSADALYGVYGEGFRANSGTDVDGRPFDANESSSIEAGLKFELLDRVLQGTVAVFELKQENMLSGDPQNPGFSVALGEARSRGVELDLSVRIVGNDLHFSYAYVDAEATKGVPDYNFGRQISPGDRLINVPRHSPTRLTTPTPSRLFGSNPARPDASVFRQRFVFNDLPSY